MGIEVNVRRALALTLAAVLTGVSALPAQLPAIEYEGAQALGLSARRLGHTKSVLMIGAHPDDESTQILSTLALGDGARVAYLSLTRGEGGQNGIGPELQEGLGLIRSEELLAARRLDGATQYFTRAYDYGFSKSADEAFEHWPREEVLADVVAAIRDSRPDIIISIFSGTERDGHGQHQAAGMLAREAFHAAGDPSRFPDQLAAGLALHEPAKLYQGLWRGEEADHRLETGRLDPLLGRSYYQIAMASRSRHRSQDMGQILTPGPQSSNFILIEGRGREATPLFAGVDTLLSVRADDARVREALRRYERDVTAARANLDLADPARALDRIASASVSLARAATATADDALRALIGDERAELSDFIWLTAGLRADAFADDETLAPGQTFILESTFWNGGDRPVEITRWEPRLPAGWRAVLFRWDASETVGPGAVVTRAFEVTVAADAEPTQPYFLAAPRDADMYRWPEGRRVGVPFQPSPVRMVVEARVADVPISRTLDAVRLTLDKMSGEVRRPVRVVPTVSVTLDPRSAVVRVADPDQGPVRVVARVASASPRPIGGALVPRLPDGWSANPRQARVEFMEGSGEEIVEFEITPPPGVNPGGYSLQIPFVTDDGAEFSDGYRLIDYPHTAPRALYSPAAVSLSAIDVEIPAGLRIGYIAGPGDDVLFSLRQLGLDVAELGPQELAGADLSAFDVIVTGIRAYEVRPDLTRHNRRLLDYVAAGGTLIVQYNKYEYEAPGIAPYPIAMSRPHDRVTDEGSPVRILRPDHPVLTTPNRIGERDFDNWVHERGLYFLSEWDDAFEPLLEMNDPGDPPLRGGLLIAPYGDGTYVYTGLAFFRQLPEGVPGAFRLFANLLAIGDR